MRITFWCVRCIALFAVLLILQGAYDVDVMGAVLVSAMAVVWAVLPRDTARRD